MQHPNLRLVVNNDAPPPSNSTTRLLKAVLDARLTPALTVEQACHLDTMSSTPGLNQFLTHFKQLHSAGLACDGGHDDRPAAIVLKEPAVFAARFPHLVDAVAPMLAHDGVLPYTNGEPRFYSAEMRGFNDSELADYVARQLILEHVVGDKTVRKAMEDCTDADTQTLLVNMEALEKIGIKLFPKNLCNVEEEDNSEFEFLANGFATIVKPEKLSRRIPALQKLGIDLRGLQIY